VDDNLIVSEREFDDYLKTTFVTYVLGEYEKSKKIKVTLAQFLSDLIKAVEKNKLQSTVCDYVELFVHQYVNPLKVAFALMSSIFF